MFDIRIRPKILLLIAILVSGLLILLYSLPKGSIQYQICDKSEHNLFLKNSKFNSN